eukprot:3011709-Pyramimonas_sp.AAC.1
MMLASSGPAEGPHGGLLGRLRGLLGASGAVLGFVGFVGRVGRILDSLLPSKRPFVTSWDSRGGYLW